VPKIKLALHLLRTARCTGSRNQ